MEHLHQRSANTMLSKAVPLFLCVLLVLLTTLVVVCFYLNRPNSEPLADTWSYLYVVDRIQNHGQLVNFWRLPGYPLLIVLIYAVMGQGNFAAISGVQAVLYILATVEIYFLAMLLLRRAWIAFLIALLVGTNISLLSFVKPIMSEPLALWLLTSLALAVAIFITTLHIRALWLVTICTLLLFLIRPEWIYLPVLLFAYLLLIAIWRGVARRLLPHIVLSVLLLYAVLGGYIAINATQNNFVGVTWIENINELGKVLQYDMQNEASPQYAAISRTLDSYTTHGIRDPYLILEHEPSFSRNDAALSGAFARSVIERHPVVFLRKSVRVFFSSLIAFDKESQVVPDHPFGRLLARLQFEFQALYKWNRFLLPCAAIWLLLLCWKRARDRQTIQVMGGMILLSLYGAIITVLGAYRNYDYMRIHTVFEPLVILIIWGTFLVGTVLIVQQGPVVLAQLSKQVSHHQKVSLATGNLLLTILSGIILSLCVVRQILAPGLASLIAVSFSFGICAVSFFRYFHLREVR